MKHEYPSISGEVYILQILAKKQSVDDDGLFTLYS